MSYFNDCMDVLVTLASTNLNTNIKAACTAVGVVWNNGVDVNFSSGTPNFLHGDYEPEDLLFQTETQFPCLSIYFNGFSNSDHAMSMTFAGPVSYGIDMHLASESSDQTELEKLKMAVAEGVVKTYDALDVATRALFTSKQVTYSRGVSLQVQAPKFLSANQWVDYDGADMWVVKLPFHVMVNLRRI